MARIVAHRGEKTVARELLQELRLFKENPHLLDEDAYMLHSDVSQDVLDCFVERLANQDSQVQLNASIAEGLRSLCDELGFAGFERDFATFDARAPSPLEELLSEVRSLRQQIAANEAWQKEMKARLDQLEQRVAAQCGEPPCVVTSEDSSDQGSLRQEVDLLKKRQGQVERIVMDTMSNGAADVFGVMVKEAKHSKSPGALKMQYKTLADRGNILAAFRYSVSLYQDKSWNRGRGDSAELFHRLAEEGCLPAVHNYGVALLQGEGVPQDKAKAVQCFKLASDRGDSKAALKYGLCLANGEGVERNLPEAVKYLTIAANQGIGQAVVELKKIFSENDPHDLGVPEDVIALRQMADNGDKEAQNKYGLMLKHGDRVARDMFEAVRYFHMAAEQGLADAQYNFGMCLKEGTGVMASEVEAQRYLEMAARQGHAKSLCILSSWLSGHGHGAKQAMEYLRMCADQGDRVAQMEMAKALFKEGRKHSAKEAFYYLQRAADNGDAAAQIQCAEALWNGQDVPVDRDKALHYMERAAFEGEIPDAHYFLGLCYEKGDGVPVNLKKAAWHFSWGADRDHPPSLLKYGICLEEGLGVTQNPWAATYFYNRARCSETKDGPEASFRLGLCFLKGVGIERSEDSAMTCFIQAGTNDHAEAKFYWAFYMDQRYGDKKKVASLYREAGQLGYQMGNVKYGLMLKSGTGVRKDLKEAARHFEWAASAGEPEGQFQFGLCLKNGDGVKRDLQKACAYFEMAAGQGHAGAKAELAH